MCLAHIQAIGENMVKIDTLGHSAVAKTKPKNWIQNKICQLEDLLYRKILRLGTTNSVDGWHKSAMKSTSILKEKN